MCNSEKSHGEMGIQRTYFKGQPHFFVIIISWEIMGYHKNYINPFKKQLSQ
jgi:hypothetical protein